MLAANTTGTNIGASFDGGVLTLSGTDTIAHYQQVLESITYNNTSGDPTVASETINIVAMDDAGKSGNMATSTISVAAIPINLTLNHRVDDNVVLTTSAISIADNPGIIDPFSANLANITLTLANPQPGDVLTADTRGTNIAARFSGGVLTLTGVDTLIHYQSGARFDRLSR